MGTIGENIGKLGFGLMRLPQNDGAMDIDLNARYYGELDFRMQYKKVKGAPFGWLYVDFDTLAGYARESGFRAELVAEGEHYDYLARLSALK